MKVAIELMDMESDPGYVYSGGSTRAFLIDTNLVVDCAGEEESLLRLNGKEICKEDLSDIIFSKKRYGVLTYTYTTGIFTVPKGMTVIQKKHIDICTDNEEYYSAWIVNPNSLRDLYSERAEKYAALAAS